MLNYGVDISEYSSQFVQYVADNVDHNIRTLDGNDTLHGMGMIAAITPGVNKSQKIPRVKVTPKNITAMGSVPVQFIREKSIGAAMKNCIASKVKFPQSI